MRSRPCSPVKRRIATVVLGINVSAAVHEEALRPWTRSNTTACMQRCIAIGVFRVDVGAEAREKVHDLELFPQRGTVERRPARGVPRFNVSAAVHEDFRDLGAFFHRGFVERLSSQRRSFASMSAPRSSRRFTTLVASRHSRRR